jgi:lipoprotein-anchoring transpeptidase ErfK/SrfK
MNTLLKFRRSGHGVPLLVWVLPALCPLLQQASLAQDDGTRLAPLYAAQVDRKLDVPEDDQRSYGELAQKNLSGRIDDETQYVVIVDRNDFVQAAMIYWMSPDRQVHFIGASPVSTGKPGRFEHFVTPTGVFEHTTENPDFRSKGTRNENGIRGYGAKGMRVYDFGWQSAIRGWGKGGEGKLRLQMHATDPDRLSQKLGTPQSEGCVRIPATLNTFIDRHGILDGDYDRAMAAGQMGIIRLAEKYSAQRVEAASERALLSGACRYKSVESILRNSLDQVPPSSPPPSSTPPHDNIRGSEYFE